MKAQPALSLKARALRFLAQREHSRSELRQKLLPHALAACRPAGRDHVRDHGHSAPERTTASEAQAEDAAPIEAVSVAVVPETLDDVGPCLDKLLDWLQERDYLSEARFVESRLHARAARFGARRIIQELAQHGVRVDDETKQALRRSELDRARDVWRRKFAAPPADAATRARQARFLSARGFSADVIRLVLRGTDDDSD